MAQVFPQYDSDGPQESGVVQEDLVLREGLEQQLREAAERKTFHENETERWDRIGRSSAAALIELNAQRPVPMTTPEDFIEGRKPSVGQNVVRG